MFGLVRIVRGAGLGEVCCPCFFYFCLSSCQFHMVSSREPCPWRGIRSAQVGARARRARLCVCVCVCVWWVGAQCFWHQQAAGLCVCGAVTPSTCMLFGSTSKLPAAAMLTWTWPPFLREINTFPSLWLCSLGSKLEM